jgi:tetratricopeptide (TPR) repeat protein
MFLLVGNILCNCVFPTDMKARLTFALLVVSVAARGDTPLAKAIALFQAKDFPAARAAFEAIAHAEPRNPAACFYLGLTLEERGDAHALDDAAPWLEKAVQLEPDNATYLAEFGGVSMELAQKNHSLIAATKGREAMEKAVSLDPDNLDARQGLFEYYEQAPWPLGSSEKAATELDEISRRDPVRAIALSVRLKTDAKDYTGAFRICDDLLKKNPDDYTALYQFGRTAAISGLRLTQGIACLQKCLTLTPPSAASPRPTHVWTRIGILQEKLGLSAEARASYAIAVKLDPANRQASDSLANLK